METKTHRLVAALTLAACFNATAEGATRLAAFQPDNPYRQGRPSPSAGPALSGGGLAQSVYPFVSRALSIEDEYVKARTLTGLADVLWKYDEPVSRQLFNAAATALRGKEGAPLPASLKKRWLMAGLVGRAAKHDPEMALGLLRPDEDGAPALYLQAARALVKDNPLLAVEFAARGLDGDGAGEVGSFLFDLRAKDPSAADRFFARVMHDVKRQGTVDGETLMKLGAYVFTSPAVGPSGNGYEMTAVSGRYAVNLSTDRSDASREAVRTYLRTAVDIIARPTMDPRQQQLYYITAYQLLPRVRSQLPTGLPELTAAMERLAAAVPKELTEPSSYRTLAAESYRPAPELSAAVVDRIRDQARRDETGLGLAHAYCMSGRFSEAQDLAGKVSDDALRASLADVINFRRAAATLASGGSVSQAALETGAVKGSVMRGLLWLGVARRLAHGGDKAGAVAAIDKARYGARETFDPHAPYLLLTAANLYAGINIQEASNLLEEAVQAFNRSEGGAATWAVELRAGTVSREFPLAVEGVHAGLEESLTRLIAAGVPGTVDAVMMINNEQALGPAILALVGATLKLSERALVK